MLKLGNSFGFLNFFIYLCIVKQEILTIKKIKIMGQRT